ncbi:MAG: hypothetical protein ACLFPL_05790 [Candidatus Nanoarchaeia archaeon]
MKYEIKSQYIKDKIQGVDYSDKELVLTIKDICTLEEFIITPPVTHSQIQTYLYLKSEYHQDYLHILQELQPEAYEEELEQTQKESELTPQQSVEEMNWWKKYGGVGVDKILSLKLRILRTHSKEELLQLEKELQGLEGE